MNFPMTPCPPTLFFINPHLLPLHTLHPVVSSALTPVLFTPTMSASDAKAAKRAKFEAVFTVIRNELVDYFKAQ